MSGIPFMDSRQSIATTTTDLIHKCRLVILSYLRPIVIAHISRGAGSMQRPGVRLYVCPMQHEPTAANPLMQICCCGPSEKKISIELLHSRRSPQPAVQQRRANAGSDMLSAYVVGLAEHRHAW